MESKSISLKRGESTTVSFPSHAMSGYLWEYEVADGAVVSIETTQQASGAEKNGNGQPQAIGASSAEQFAIRGLGAGSTRITFRQRRNWETGVAPLNTEVYEVKVED